ESARRVANVVITQSTLSVRREVPEPSGTVDRLLGCVQRCHHRNPGDCCEVRGRAVIEPGPQRPGTSTVAGKSPWPSSCHRGPQQNCKTAGSGFEPSGNRSEDREEHDDRATFAEDAWLNRHRRSLHYQNFNFDSAILRW